MHEWDAHTYDEIALPHQRWGTQAISRLALAGDETVLDAGCGTGRDVERLLDALPGGRVVALDASDRMLAQLRMRLGERIDRVTTVYADMREPISLPERVDAILSVATLHWLADHQVVFDNLARVLSRGARFVAEAGGEGNVATFQNALIKVCGHDGGQFRNFASVDETVMRLKASGFRDMDVRLVPDTVQLTSHEQFESFLATLMLRPELRGLEPQAQRQLIRSVAREMGEPVLDFVRLNILATRA